jgi:hypothetical protein
MIGPTSDAEVPASWQSLGRPGLAEVLLGSDLPNLPPPYAKQLSALAELDLGDEAPHSLL